MDMREKALLYHREARGKIVINGNVSIKDKADLALAYTPGVAEPCREIAKNKDLSYEYTRRWNLVGVISDGSAVLGLGDIGPYAAMPVMEGKALLFKEFGDVDAIPLCIKGKTVEQIVDIISSLEPTFGGINLEDISAPRCFDIERALKERMDIPVFHDDQHGTAIVVLAALINALKVVKKEFNSIKVVINGAGSAGIAICKLLMSAGTKNILLCDKTGIICQGDDGLNSEQEKMAAITNRNKEKGSLADAFVGAEVFIGVSAPNIVTADMIKTMEKGAICFAMANPTPEIFPDVAISAGALIAGTGRSDFDNQINNVLAFPGVFRGALDARASEINAEMKLAAANAIASLVKEDELSPNYIIAPALDRRVCDVVAKAVYEAAVKTGVSRI